MRRSRQRSWLLLAVMLLASLLVLCALVGFGMASRAVTLPPVLAHNDAFWLGDRCRADEDYLKQHDCLSGYTVDLVLYGDQMRHYTVLHIPALKDDRSYP